MRVKYIKPALSVFVLYFLTGLEVAAQQTVGIFKNTPQALKGYVLMAPLGDSVTYLLNNCGEVVHRWVSKFHPGLSCYLLEDGTLVRPFQVPNATFNGQGGRWGAKTRLERQCFVELPLHFATLSPTP